MANILKKFTFSFFIVFLIALIFIADLRFAIVQGAGILFNRELNTLVWQAWLQNKAPLLLGILLFLFLIKNSYHISTNFLNNFLNFIFKNRWSFFLGFATLILIYGRQLYVFNGRIDTETLINITPKPPVHYGLGRFGDMITRQIFEGGFFNPYYSSVLAFLFLGIALILFSYLCNKIGKINPAFSSAVFVLFMVHPIWMEQFYFHQQIKEISFALVLIFLALICIHKIAQIKRPLFLIGVVPLFVWILSTYQSLIFIYLAATLFFFLLHSPPPENADSAINLETKNAWRFVLYCAVVFVAGYFANEIIFRAMGANLDYVKNQFCWGKSPLSVCMKQMVVYTFFTAMGGGASEAASYGVGFLLSAILLFIVGLRYARHPRWVFWMAYILLQLCAFALILYAANIPAARSQMPFTFVVAANFALVFFFLPAQNATQIVAGFFAIFVFLSQANAVLRLQYTDDLRFQNDLLLMNNVEQRVGLVGATDLPLVIVGGAPLRLNNVAAQWELIGKPLTRYATGEGQYKTPNELHNFAKAQGVIFKLPDAATQQRGLAESKTMPIFPADGSVKNMGDFVIVKLGEPGEK